MKLKSGLMAKLKNVFMYGVAAVALLTAHAAQARPGRTFDRGPGPAPAPRMEMRGGYHGGHHGGHHGGYKMSKTERAFGIVEAGIAVANTLDNIGATAGMVSAANIAASKGAIVQPAVVAPVTAPVVAPVITPVVTPATVISPSTVVVPTTWGGAAKVDARTGRVGRTYDNAWGNMGYGR